MIIGRDTIKKYKLFEKIPSQLSSDGINHDDLVVVEGTNLCACQQGVLPRSVPKWVNPYRLTRLGTEGGISVLLLGNRLVTDW